MESIVALIFGVFALIGWQNYLRYQRYKSSVSTTNHRFEILLKQVGDQQAILAFLQSPEGYHLMEKLTQPSTSTKVPVLVMICAGIISFATGAGAVLLTIFVDDDLIFGAIFLCSGGIGLLISAWIAYHLSKKWGVFESDSGQQEVWSNVGSLEQQAAQPE